MATRASTTAVKAPAKATAPKVSIDPAALLAEFTAIVESGEAVNPSVKTLVEALDRIPGLVQSAEVSEQQSKATVEAAAALSKSLGFDTSRGNVLAKQIAALNGGGFFGDEAEAVQSTLTRWAKIATPSSLRGKRGSSNAGSFPRRVRTTDPRSPGWSSDAQTSNNLRQAMLVHERDAHGGELDDIGDAWIAARDALMKGEASTIPGRYVFEVA